MPPFLRDQRSDETLWFERYQVLDFFGGAYKFDRYSQIVGDGKGKASFLGRLKNLHIGFYYSGVRKD